ncbi:probable LRR receptor-like serine/threonine-protein kinase At1g74360 [Triticum dicoccoides]|uniref:probable LRR receptor-like serine/threonine-protein kinase At1g74360 n=1 Tax=Triticum dicoccoides TaxID=85692 RepID=UPI000E791FA2|nr:probable LRR receptor-like serine/threonine-protein kinase At1g74360 [Triticum dicoccoides]
MIQGRQAMSPSLLLAFLCGLIFIAGEAALIATESGGGDDKEVLLELKRFLIANNKVNRGGYEAWQESDPSPCLWRGVGCNRGGRVTSLNLTCSTMSGPAFGNFSRLSVLTSLDLSDNSIIGALPVSDLNQCHGLVHLNISHNLITGSLNVSGLTKLRVLDVSANRLEGGIAFDFPAICTNLTLLHLSTNNIAGNITNMLEGCARLEYVDLSSNNFDGELLPDVARFRKFSIAENNITGSVPWSMFPNGCKLQSLDLSANQLVGSFPDSIAKCTNLTYLSLWGNNFAGMVPAGIGKLASLEALVLGKNRFDRQIPHELTNCVRLQFLDISRNMFGGNVQEIFGNFMSLKYLVLHHNNYTGGIVASGVLRLPLLARLDLSFNEFTSDLPQEVANMKSLKYLTLADNNFSGRIPPEYGRLAELQALDLSNNTLSGGIPASIGNLTSLLWLILAGNQLFGEIPPEIGYCTSLLWLNLADNQLTGNIPPEMAEMGRNPGPTFAKNRNDTSVFIGSNECQAMRRWIPASYRPFSFVNSVLTDPRTKKNSVMTGGNCRNIWDRILKGYIIVPMCTNSLSVGSLPGYVQLSRNMLSGEIPPRIGTMWNIGLLFLDGNCFTGQLPRDIGRLPLVELNISRNNMSGPIPSEIGEYLCLERMDLSFNNLSDELPTSLFKLTELVMFNVSYNPLLSGNISTTGQFGTFDEQSFLGDPLISLDQGGPAGKQQPGEEAPYVTAVERSSVPTSILVSYFFFLVVGFIYGTVSGW